LGPRRPARYVCLVARIANQDAIRRGTILSGKLRVERVVGQGSMGIVLEATDLQLQRRVAVKIMAPGRAGDHDARKRFLREARAAGRLSSEHVTRLIELGELDDGTPFLVMEYLVGSTLEQLLVRDGPPSIDVAVDWVLQALEGVAEAHRAGLVHRDLKPENLFLCERPGRPPIVKVLDFGTVKDLVTKGTKLTRTGSTMGSPAYMPPEQVRAEDIDQRADVWAMGVTLYELISGHLPFGGESVMQTLAAILRDDPVPLQHRRPSVPSELGAIVTCALSKNPAGRYASANELLAALASVRATMPRTTTVTKTVQMGRNLQFSRPDAFADTTEMNRLSDIDASRVRARVLVDERRTVVTRPRPTPPSRIAIFLAALGAAILVGGMAGFVATRVRPPPPAPVASTTLAPSPTAVPTPTPTATATATATASAAHPPSTTPGRHPR